jgi:hypothetical protein
VKLKTLLLVMVALAGLSASYALADDGHGHGQGKDWNGKDCGRGVVVGTVSPQTFTVTVTHTRGDSGLQPGGTVTVSVGGTGQTVRLGALGCLNGSALTAKEVFLAARHPDTNDGTTSTATTGDDGEHHHKHGCDTTTTSTVATGDTTTAANTTTGDM